MAEPNDKDELHLLPPVSASKVASHRNALSRQLETAFR